MEKKAKSKRNYVSGLDVRALVIDDGYVDSIPSKPATSSKPVPNMSAERVRALALEAGFTEAGLVSLPHHSEALDAERFKAWVQAGRAGTMDYLARTSEGGLLTRAQVGIPFPWARSVVVCFASYHADKLRSTDVAAVDAGWIARYAWSSRVDAQGVRRNSDYHKVLLKRVHTLEARLHAEFGEFEARAFVDTGPLVERALARAAGLGWTGKNTCLIHPKWGSFGFLAVLVTSLAVESEKLLTAPLPDRCGSCRRCIEACPTDALVAPYQMDASQCIAYLTIEHRGAIAPELMDKMGRQVFGCDICQDVCPWNRKAVISTDAELEARPELVNPALEWLAQLDEAEYERQFNGSPVRRAKFHGLQRNVAIAMGNSGQSGFASRLGQWVESADEGLRTAARWAIAKLRHP